MKNKRVKLRTFKIDVPVYFADITRHKKDTFIEFCPMHNKKFYKFIGYTETIFENYHRFVFRFEKLQNLKSLTK